MNLVNKELQDFFLEMKAKTRKRAGLVPGAATARRRKGEAFSTRLTTLQAGSQKYRCARQGSLRR